MGAKNPSTLLEFSAFLCTLWSHPQFKTKDVLIAVLGLMAEFEVGGAKQTMTKRNSQKSPSRKCLITIDTVDDPYKEYYSRAATAMHWLAQ